MCVLPCPGAGGCWLCGWLPTELLAYRDRMESLDKSFFSSAFVVVVVEVEEAAEEEVEGSACRGAPLEPDYRGNTRGEGMKGKCYKI